MHPNDRDGVRSVDDLLALDGSVFIRQAYRTMLGREPDPGGFVAYLLRLEAGTPKGQIVRELSDSPEGRRQRAPLRGLQAVATASGTDEAPQSAGAAVAAPPSLRALLASDGHDFIPGAYRLLLGREPDADGAAAYRTRLAQGATREELVLDIGRSEEFQHRGVVIEGLAELKAPRPVLLERLKRTLRRLLGRGPGQAAVAQGALARPRDATPDEQPLAAAPRRPAEETTAREIPAPDEPTGFRLTPAHLARAWLLTLPGLDDRPSR